MTYQDQNRPAYQEKRGPEARLGEGDIEQIVVSSGLPSRPQLPGVSLPFEVVQYMGNLYKVRAYPNGEAAQECLEFMTEAQHLFTRCYGRIDRFLVLEYLDKDNRLLDITSGSPRQILDGIADFLSDLAVISTRRSPEDDFDNLCRNIQAARIFQPRTIELIRGYYSQAGALNLEWGLEYYDPLPRNFAFTLEGKLVAIDEKHLRLGPRGASLVKPMDQLPAEDFRKLKEAYLAKTHSVPFEDANYLRFLRFYRHITALGTFLGAYRPRQVNMYAYHFHSTRVALLRIVGISPLMRMREETQWIGYWLRKVKRVPGRVPGFLERRVLRAVARLGSS